jgi:hypothetical protein
VDDTTKTMVLSLVTGVVKKVLIAGGTAAATHGFISGVSTEAYAGAAAAVVAAGVSFWQDYGRAIVLSQLEVLKAKSLASAAKLHAAGVPSITTAEIAAQSPTLTATTVEKVANTMTPEIKASVIPQKAA